MNKKVKRIHFVGIGGSGMNGLAEVFKNLGYIVSGSDIQENENVKRLKKIGIKVYIGHKKSNVKNVDIVVYSNAIPETNCEIVEAKKRKIPVIPRAVMLDEVMRLKTGIAIAGTHGKTTTTSMTAHIFEKAKKDPTYIIGGVVKSGGRHAKSGKGEYVIVEACEAFGSFLHLNPVIIGVTNIDNDHLDYYKNMDALKEAFISFINKVPFYGTAYLNGDDENIKSILNNIFVKYYLFGLNKKNDFYIKNIQEKGFKQKFSVYFKDKKLGTFEILIPGRHNIYNALLSIIIAFNLGIKTKIIKEALKTFKPVKRRFNIFKLKKYIIIDDYAHHPEEVKNVLLTGKKIIKNKIIAIFQPHLYSRTKFLYNEFANALKIADYVILDKIYPAREIEIPGVSSKLILDSMKANNFKNVYYEKNWKNIVFRIKKIIKPGDCIFLLGAGDIYKLKDLLEKELK